MTVVILAKNKAFMEIYSQLKIFALHFVGKEK